MKNSSDFSLVQGFPCSSAGKESACNVEDLGSISRLGRFPGEGKGYPLQYSDLKNSMDSIVHGVAKSRTWLSDWTELKVSRVWLFATPWTIQSMEFSRLEYWSGSLSLLQGIFPTQGSNPGLLPCGWILYQLSHKGLKAIWIMRSEGLPGET